MKLNIINSYFKTALVQIKQSELVFKIVKNSTENIFWVTIFNSEYISIYLIFQILSLNICFKKKFNDKIEEKYSSFLGNINI